MLAGEALPGKLRTMLVIDEAKLLALRGKGDPLGVLNRLATEAMHAETAIRTTAGRLLLEKGQLQALREPFVGLVNLGGGGGEG